MLSVYVVGDIHGCYDALMRLEGAIRLHAQALGRRPLIVAVGDLIDRGPDSRNVVQRFMRGVAAGTHVAVAGNHEAILLELLFTAVPQVRELLHMPHYLVPVEAALGDKASPAERREYVHSLRRSWLRQGGSETILSFECDPVDVASWLAPVDELRFLAGLPLIWESEQTVVSHALAEEADIAYARAVQRGDIRPDILSPEHDHHIRGLLWNRDCPTGPADPDKMHISGHTPARDVVRFDHQRRIVIDTACVYGNRLTAWSEETGEFIDVSGWNQRE